MTGWGLGGCGWTVALALVGLLGGCGSGGDRPPLAGGEPDASAEVDAGLVALDAGAEDAGSPDAADAGAPDAGPSDAADAGRVFGTPGPWPLANVLYGPANGLREGPVVGVTTDETQNLWVATPKALYLLRPGQLSFQRFDSAQGLHLQSNPVAYCDSNFARGDRACPIYGAAADPGITTLEGGGSDEVFVGYAGAHGTGDWSDPNRHSGKLDRVRLKADGSLQVDRIDLVANAHGAQYWHNKTVHRLLFDHFIHPHELYAGCNHGVTLLRPDSYRQPKAGEWFDTVAQEYMADHLHPRVCFHAPCVDGSTANQRMGDWHGLALAANGSLWVAGKWTAGAIRWSGDLKTWLSRPGASAFEVAFGDPYPISPNGVGFINEPVFRPPAEGDEVNLSAVTVAPDGRVWFASSNAAYGLAVWNGRSFFTYLPVSELGAEENEVSDLVALPDGRLAIGFPRSGLMLWHPGTGARTRLGQGSGLPDDRIQRLALDTMVNPPALMVATQSGAAVLRVLP